MLSLLDNSCVSEIAALIALNHPSISSELDFVASIGGEVHHREMKPAKDGRKKRKPIPIEEVQKEAFLHF